ncbi:hypothetical protein Glove_819000g4 [Diversispora epigaea]|uniref:Uncharacterized protein n=1 Tax=Diversispora epigaea TaxID=1348612 RepID=A0A397FWS8_9GLOM|nr:hypothetical protein Glove_819000g4 [Diversispora epigaea]
MDNWLFYSKSYWKKCEKLVTAKLRKSHGKIESKILIIFDRRTPSSCEHSFFTLKWILGDHRTRMSVEKLEGLAKDFLEIDEEENEVGNNDEIDRRDSLIVEDIVDLINFNDEISEEGEAEEIGILEYNPEDIVENFILNEGENDVEESDELVETNKESSQSEMEE